MWFIVKGIDVMVCFVVLQLGNVFNGLAPEPPPFTYRTKCSKCGRLNAGDARFCDWCGNKVH